MAGDRHHSFGATCKEVEERLERSPQLCAAHAACRVDDVVSMTLSWWHVRHVLLGTRRPNIRPSVSNLNQLETRRTASSESNKQPSMGRVAGGGVNCPLY